MPLGVQRRCQPTESCTVMGQKTQDAIEDEDNVIIQGWIFWYLASDYSSGSDDVPCCLLFFFFFFFFFRFCFCD